MKWVFIDSSAFLKMYSYNYDFSKNLKEILKLIEGKKIKLILTKQVLDEIEREREKRLGEFMGKLSKWKESILNIPPFCEEIPPAKAIKNLSKRLYENLLDKAKKETLNVDIIFKKICKKCEIIPVDSRIFEEAKKRYDMGNPPGKRQIRESYGDSINWIILMERIPKGESLYFISADKDFSSELDDSIFSLFLSKEIYSKKKSKVVYYSSISGFLKEEFKENITEKQIEQEKSALPEPIQLHEISVSGANIIPSPFGSDTKIFSGSIINSSPFGSEREIKCANCGKIFYSKSWESHRGCPYCGCIEQESSLTGSGIPDYLHPLRT